jgi:hypothetical protein
MLEYNPLQYSLNVIKTTPSPSLPPLDVMGGPLYAGDACRKAYRFSCKVSVMYAQEFLVKYLRRLV